MSESWPKVVGFMGMISENRDDRENNDALHKIAQLRGIHASAMRDKELLAVDAVTEESIQTVFQSLSQLLDIAEAAVQYSRLNISGKAWFQEEIAEFVKPS